MLTCIFGNHTAALTMLLLQRKGAICPTEAAVGLGLPVNMVQKQLERLERGGVVGSGREGRRRIYRWNPQHPVAAPLRDVLERANALGPSQDPADGTHLTFQERVEVAESLWRELRGSRRTDDALGVARTFNSFEAYHAWQEKQKIV